MPSDARQKARDDEWFDGRRVARVLGGRISRHDLGGTSQYEVLRAEQERDLIVQVQERWWHRFSRWLVQARPIPKLTYRNEAAQALTRWRAEEDRFANRWAGTSHTWTANDLIDGETAPDRIVNGDDLV